MNVLLSLLALMTPSACFSIGAPKPVLRSQMVNSAAASVLMSGGPVPNEYTPLKSLWESTPVAKLWDASPPAAILEENKESSIAQVITFFIDPFWIIFFTPVVAVFAYILYQAVGGAIPLPSLPALPALPF